MTIRKTFGLCAIVLLAVLEMGLVQRVQAPLTTTKALIEGIVTSAETGQPLRKARILLEKYDPSNLSTHWTRVPVAMTDSLGHFSIAELEPGQYRAEVEREGFVTQKHGQKAALESGQAFMVAAGENLKLDFRMLRAGVISGRVFGQNGRPILRAAVQAYIDESIETRRTLRPVAATDTNDRGEYRLFSLPPGRYIIGTMMPLGSVPGVNESGGGSDGFVNLLQPAGHPYPQVYFPGTLAPENADLVNLLAGEVGGIDFMLQPVKTFTIRGHVSVPFPQAPRPMEHFGISSARMDFVRLNLIRMDGPRLGLPEDRGQAVNSDGSFAIQGVFLKGAYTLIATGRPETGPLHAARMQVEIKDADIGGLTLELRSAIDIAGKIILNSPPPESFRMANLRIRLITTDEIPIGGSFVVFTGDGATKMKPVLDMTSGVDTDGSFRFKNVVPLRYRLSVDGLPPNVSIMNAVLGSLDILNVPFVIEGGGNRTLQITIDFHDGSR